MANVYAATHRNGSKVALKILHKSLASDVALCERFAREGYFANAIGHPGVVRAIDDDMTEDGCPFLVLELLEGETLDERRRREGGTLPLAWLLPVADSILDVLAAAHAHEIVHRDVKPSNIFITSAGVVKVLDFGVARWNDGKSSSPMTKVGMVVGTPAYMPPEQALGRREEVDAKSDLWAVGATLFMALSGESVHAGGDAKAKLIATARSAARPLRDVAPDVPRAVAAVIDRALAFHKGARWADAESMREALRWAGLNRDGAPSQSPETLQPDTRRMRPPAPTRRAEEDGPSVVRAFANAIASEHTPEPSAVTCPVPSVSAPLTLRDAPSPVSTRAPVPGAHPTPVALCGLPPIVAVGREKADSEDQETANFPTLESLSKRMEVGLNVTQPMQAVTAVPPLASRSRPSVSRVPVVRGSAESAPEAPPESISVAVPYPSRPPSSPGPLLSEIVEPRRGGFARGLLVFLLALVIAMGVAVVYGRLHETIHENASFTTPVPVPLRAATSASAGMAEVALTSDAVPVVELLDASVAPDVLADASAKSTLSPAPSASETKRAKPKPRRKAVPKPAPAAAASEGPPVDTTAEVPPVAEKSQPPQLPPF